MSSKKQIELTEESTYSEIKAWYKSEWKNLPKNLRGNDKYYNYVKFIVKLWMKQIETALERNSSKVKENETAAQAKENLYELYIDLKDKSQWNLGMMTLTEYNNSKKSEE